MLKQKKNTKSLSCSGKSNSKAQSLLGFNDIEDIWSGGITLDLTRWTSRYDK